MNDRESYSRALEQGTLMEGRKAIRQWRSRVIDVVRQTCWQWNGKRERERETQRIRRDGSKEGGIRFFLFSIWKEKVMWNHRTWDKPFCPTLYKISVLHVVLNKNDMRHICMFTAECRTKGNGIMGWMCRTGSCGLFSAAHYFLCNIRHPP